MPYPVATGKAFLAHLGRNSFECDAAADGATTFLGRGDPLVFVSIDSAEVEVLCFDTVLQVFIPR
jgi:hypothetical protein